MINYSVFLQQNPADKTKAAKAYAKAQVNEVMTFRKFVQHIADHNGAYSRGTVSGVVSDMCDCLVEQLLNGNKVLLGDLGSFWLTLASKGADSMAEFTANDITAVNILFTPGSSLQNLLPRAQFNAVSSRVAQEATLKAEKNGQGTVDLSAAKTKKSSDADSSGSSSGSGSGSSSGSGSGSSSGSDTGSGSSSSSDTGSGTFQG